MLKPLVNTIDSFVTWLNIFNKKELAEYIDIEAMHDDKTLIMKDGSLVSLFEIDGYRYILTKEDLIKMVNTMTSKLKKYFKDETHMMQFVFTSDILNAQEEAILSSEEYQKYNQEIGLNLDEIIEERNKILASKTNHEKTYIALYSRITSYHNINGFYENHIEFLNDFEEITNSLKLSVIPVDVYEMTKVIKRGLTTNIESDFKPLFIGDKISSEGKKHMKNTKDWDIMSVSLNQQLSDYPVNVVNNKIVQMGNKIFGSVIMDVFPKNILTFAELQGNLKEKIPFRLSLTISGGNNLNEIGKKSIYSLLPFVEYHKLVQESLPKIREQLVDMYDVNVKVRLCASSWMFEKEEKELEKNMIVLGRALQQWGQSLVNEVNREPVAGVISSNIATTYNSVAPTSMLSLSGALFMSPITRPATPYKTGNFNFISPDSKTIPYQYDMSQEYKNIAILGQHQSGKSLLLNQLNLAYLTTPTIGYMPKLKSIDISMSNVGLIDFLKRFSKEDLSKKINYYKISHDSFFSINIFDLPMGCKTPFQRKKDFLINYFDNMIYDASLMKPKDRETLSDNFDLIKDIISISREKQLKDWSIDNSIQFIYWLYFLHQYWKEGKIKSFIFDGTFTKEELQEFLNIIKNEEIIKNIQKKYPKNTFMIEMPQAINELFVIYQNKLNMISELIDLLYKEKINNPTKYKKGLVNFDHDINIQNETSWSSVVHHLYEKNKIQEAHMASTYTYPTMVDLYHLINKQEMIQYIEKKYQNSFLLNYLAEMIKTINQEKTIISGYTSLYIANDIVSAFDMSEHFKTGNLIDEKKFSAVYLAYSQFLQSDIYTLQELKESGLPNQYHSYYQEKIDVMMEEEKRFCFDDLHMAFRNTHVKEQICKNMDNLEKFNGHFIYSLNEPKYLNDILVKKLIHLFVTDHVKRNELFFFDKYFKLNDEVEKFYLVNKVYPYSNGRSGSILCKSFHNKRNYITMIANHLGPVEKWYISPSVNDFMIKYNLANNIGMQRTIALLSKYYPDGMDKIIEQRKEGLKHSGVYVKDNNDIYNILIKELTEKSKKIFG